MTGKRSSPRKQGDGALKNYLDAIECTNESETCVANLLDSKRFEPVHNNQIQDESFSQPLEKNRPEEASDVSTSPILDRYRLKRKMASIVGSYQNEWNENLDKYFKVASMLTAANKNECGIPYDGSKNKYDL